MEKSAGIRLYGAIGMDWQIFIIPDPFYSYFFDEQTPYALPGSLWVTDVYGDGVSRMPYPQEIVRDLIRAKDKFTEWYSVPGGPMDPADMSDKQFTHLAEISLAGDQGTDPTRRTG